MEEVVIPTSLAIAIGHVLSQLPAGQTAKMLIALDACLSEQDQRKTDDAHASQSTREEGVFDPLSEKIISTPNAA